MPCVTDLAARWPLDDQDDLRADLLAAWSTPGRGYHDTRHLAEVLDRLDDLASAGEAFARREVVLAAWFHDGVYDGRPRPEERSAAWAARALSGADCDAAEVARLVRLTEGHVVGGDDRNGAALCDADLAILAAPPDRYAEYVAGVRREYAHVPEDAFTTGRLAVLEALADKEHLFETSHGRAAWEPTARANLAAELVSLRAARGGAARDPSADGGPPRGAG
jgi:predicted metal-dependent HD superfamily phosphohydrolase